MAVSETPLAIVILAAGKGTRMKSDLHKVLHPIAGRPMIGHLLASVAELGAERTVVVAGHGREQLASALGSRATIAVQEPQLGTAHAVLQAREALAGFAGDVLVLYADVPFVRAETMRAMLGRLHAADAPAVVVLGFEPEDALAYGRVIADGDRIVKMVEHKDASEAERACRLCNSGLLAARSEALFALLDRVGNDNAQGEYYLPDVVNIAVADGETCAVVVTADPDEVAGINSRAELAEAEARWQARRRRQAMDEGATLIAPETVWFAWDTRLGRDVTVEPNVLFEPGVSVGEGTRIEANLVVPADSAVAARTLLTRENLYAFARAARSSAWTARTALSDRAREIVAVGPSVIAGLSDLIRQMEWRGRNLPPEALEADGFDDILPDLKRLRERLNELISAIERGGEAEARRADLAQFYQARVAPWFRDRLVAAGEAANDLLALSPVMIGTYIALSKLLDQPEFTSVMSAVVAGLIGRKS